MASEVKRIPVLPLEESHLPTLRPLLIIRPPFYFLSSPNASNVLLWHRSYFLSNYMIR